MKNDKKDTVGDKLRKFAEDGKLSSFQSLLSIIIEIDSELRKAKDRIEVLEAKEADLFTKYYNRGQIDAISRVLDDKIKVLQYKDREVL